MWHLAHLPAWYIIRPAGQAPHRRTRLSSNVGPRYIMSDRTHCDPPVASVAFCSSSRLAGAVRILATLGVVSSLGCMSQIRPFPEYAEGWVGTSVDRLIEAKDRPGSYASRVGWKDKRYELGNGNWVYVSPERADCTVHWEVNSSRIIVGYRTEDEGCR